MKRRISQDIWVVLALLILLSIFSVVAVKRNSSSDEGGILPVRTSYSAKWYGVKGLYDTLHTLKYPVRRSLDPITASMPDGVLFLVAPDRPFMLDEGKSLKKWMKRGNLVILVNDTASVMDASKDIKTVDSTPCTPSFLTPNASVYRTEKDAYDIEDEDESSMLTDTDKLTDEVSLAPLYQNEDGESIAYGKCGKGGMIVMSSAWALSNAGVASGDNLILVLNALDHRDPSRHLAVTFDEFHHGYGSAPGIWSLIGPSARMGLYQLGIAFIILLFAVSWRFGKPIYLRENMRYRSEYLSSMSSLLRRAGSLGLVRDEMDRRFKTVLCRRFGIHTTVQDSDVVAAAGLRSSALASELQEIISSAGASDEKSLLDLQLKRNEFLCSMKKH